jgi:hypothetical protein
MNNKEPTTSSTRSASPVKLSPETEADVRAGCEQAARREFADLSPEESDHYLETGELPERVRRWVDSYGTRSAF